VELCVEEGVPVAVCVIVVVGDTVIKAVLTMLTEGVMERVCVEVGDWDGDCVLPCVDVTLGLNV
jgi:hypothetical protein